MFANMMGGLVDKEQITKDYITDALALAAKEFNLDRSELIFIIRPIKEDFTFKVYISQCEPATGMPKKFLREITISEIVSDAE